MGGPYAGEWPRAHAAHVQHERRRERGGAGDRPLARGARVSAAAPQTSARAHGRQQRPQQLREGHRPQHLLRVPAWAHWDKTICATRRPIRETHIAYHATYVSPAPLICRTSVWGGGRQTSPLARACPRAPSAPPARSSRSRCARSPSRTRARAPAATSAAPPPLSPVRPRPPQCRPSWRARPRRGRARSGPHGTCAAHSRMQLPILPTMREWLRRARMRDSHIQHWAPHTENAQARAWG